MKGILLAGGKGTRLYPLTLAVCKQLLPIYDKPMIYYPLSVLMRAGIKEILIISTPEDLPRFSKILGSGEHLGLHIVYQEQKEPRGIAEALILGKDFIGKEAVTLILGDNIFYGPMLLSLKKKVQNFQRGALLFGYEVKDPERYGTLAFHKGKVSQIIEKPAKPPSSYAVTGLYVYDANCVQLAQTLTPSARGELEITDVNNLYLKKNCLQVHLCEPGSAWLDTGTHAALQAASLYVQTIQERQGIKIGCIEEIALEEGCISPQQFASLVGSMGEGEYKNYLWRLTQREMLEVKVEEDRVLW